MAQERKGREGEEVTRNKQIKWSMFFGKRSCSRKREAGTLRIDRWLVVGGWLLVVGGVCMCISMKTNKAWRAFEYLFYCRFLFYFEAKSVEGQRQWLSLIKACWTQESRHWQQSQDKMLRDRTMVVADDENDKWIYSCQHTLSTQTFAQTYYKHAS